MPFDSHSLIKIGVFNPTKIVHQHGQSLAWPVDRSCSANLNFSCVYVWTFLRVAKHCFIDADVVLRNPSFLKEDDKVQANNYYKNVKQVKYVVFHLVKL